MAKKSSTSNKKKVVKVDTYGQAHISSTFNNVIVTLTNSEGQVISWSSAGKMGFRGSKKYALCCSNSSCRAPKLPLTWACAKLKLMLKDRDQDVSLLFVPFTGGIEVTRNN